MLYSNQIIITLFSINKMQEQQSSVQQKSEIITQTFLSSLRELQSSIHADIQKMSALKSIYHQTQQKKFLVTFVNIMDRMSNQLQQANQMYQSIDKQIQEHEQCQYLSKELDFYQNQCIELKKTLKDKQEKLEAEKTKQLMLKKQQEYLERKLYQQTYKQMKYKSKLQAFNKKRKESASEPIKSNRTFQTRSKSMRLRNKSTQINDNLYSQIYKNRPKSLRNVTSIKTEKILSKTIPLHNKWSTNLIQAFKES